MSGGIPGKGCKVLDKSTATPFSHCVSGIIDTESCMDKLLHGSDNDLECQIVATCLNAENINGYPISVGGLQEAWEVCKNDSGLLQQLSDLLISVNTASSIGGTAGDILEPGDYETRYRATPSSDFTKPLVHGPTSGANKWSKS